MFPHLRRKPFFVSFFLLFDPQKALHKYKNFYQKNDS